MRRLVDDPAFLMMSKHGDGNIVEILWYHTLKHYCPPVGTVIDIKTAISDLLRLL